MVRRLSAFAWRDELHRGECAIRAWDEERERALREAARVIRLRRLSEDMLSTFRDDGLTTFVSVERQEAWKAEMEAVTSPPPDPLRRT